jgi:hypothetical protein
MNSKWSESPRRFWFITDWQILASWESNLIDQFWKAFPSGLLEKNKTVFESNVIDRSKDILKSEVFSDSREFSNSCFISRISTVNPSTSLRTATGVFRDFHRLSRSPVQPCNSHSHHHGCRFANQRHLLRLLSTTLKWKLRFTPSYRFDFTLEYSQSTFADHTHRSCDYFHSL